MTTPDPDKPAFFDSPKNQRYVLNLFYGCCAVLLLLDFVLHRHTYHSWENLPAFYPVYGFVGCVVLVLVAKWMRLFLMRDEAYYDRLEQGADAETPSGEGH